MTGTMTETVTQTPTQTSTPTLTATITATSTPTPKTLYVAPTGNDANTCASIAQKCKTIGAALTNAIAGDTIKVQEGTYITTDTTAVDKSLTLTGGWNSNFTSQLNTSILKPNIDGFLIASNNPQFTVLIDHFTVQNANGYAIQHTSAGSLTISNSIIKNNTYPNDGAGIRNIDGTLILNTSIVKNNNGGGISNSDVLVVNNSLISGNMIKDASRGSGIFNDGVATINNSTIINNLGREGIYNNATLSLNNSTVYNNLANGITVSAGTVTTNNSTVSNNKAIGISLCLSSCLGHTSLKNTIVANNAQDCKGTIGSAGYNLIGNATGCTFALKTGDMKNVDAKIGQAIGAQGYVPLLGGSPAINKGNPATCLSTDQRGITRPLGGRCDMGAYEYKAPTTAYSVGIPAGLDERKLPLNSVLSTPFTAYVVDAFGSPVKDVTVKFTAPGAGAGGKFGSTNVVSVKTDSSGLATAPTFTSNNIPGTFLVSVVSTGLVGSPTLYTAENLRIPTLVAPTGTVNTSLPTYRWTSIPGATQYQLEVRTPANVKFSLILGTTTCNSTSCSYTGQNELKPSVPTSYYMWRVRAKIGLSSWQDYSAYQTFRVGVKPGFWNGPKMEFFVRTAQTSIAKFAVYITVNGCGSYKIIHSIDENILDTLGYPGFSFHSAGFNVEGAFTEATLANGGFSFSHFYIPNCGYINVPLFRWTAQWKKAAQPTAITYLETTPVLVAPVQGNPSTTTNSYTIELITP